YSKEDIKFFNINERKKELHMYDTEIVEFPYSEIDIIQGRMPDGSASHRNVGTIRDSPDEWIAVMGDTHGKYQALAVNVHICEQLGVKNAIHVGDLGYALNAHQQKGLNEFETDAILADARDDFGFEMILLDG